MTQETIYVGADIGCNYAKLYAGKGKQIAIRSTVSTKPQIGVSLLGSGPDEVVLSIEDNVYAVGPRVADPLDTRISSYYTSDMNVALALTVLLKQFGDLSNAQVDACFGMPLNVFYNNRGEVNVELIKTRTAAWKRSAKLLNGTPGMRLPRDGSVFGRLQAASEGVAVFLDHVLDDHGDVVQQPDGLVVVVDIGGNTTDIAVLENGQLVFNGTSTSFEAGSLHLYERIAASAKDRMNLMRTPPLNAIEKAIRENGGVLAIGNHEENIRDILAIERRALINEICPRIEKAVNRRLDEVETVLFAGGTIKLLEEDLKAVRIGRAKTVVVEDPQFANPRGYYKYTRHLAAIAQG